MPPQPHWRRSRGGLCHRPDPPGFRFIEIDLQRTPLRKLRVDLYGGGSATGWTMRLTAQCVIGAAGHRGHGAPRRPGAFMPRFYRSSLCIVAAFTSRSSTAVAANRIAARTGSPGRRRGREAVVDSRAAAILDPYLPPNGAARTRFYRLTVRCSLDDAGEYRQRRLATSELP
jgi:hypothetical protein